MFGNYQLAIVSNEDDQFTDALAQDQISANYDLPVGPGYPFLFLNGFTLVSTQNLAYELWLFNSATNLTDDPVTDHLVGMWEFMATVAGSVGSAVTPAATGVLNPLFRYHITGNMIPYTDTDYNRSALGANRANPQLHMRIVNRSATAKNAGPTGALVITAFVSTQGVQA